MKFLTSIDLSQNEIQNAIMQPLAAPPANPKIGQIYFNSIDLTLYLWTGEKWIPVPTKTSQLENDSGFITSGDIPEGAAASTTTPKMNGTAAVGTEMAFARGDHVHPKDTSKLNTDGDGSNVTVTFEASAKREAPTSGEKLSVLLGKVLKFFSDLKTVAFSGSYKDLSDKPTIPSAAADVGAIPATEKGAAGGVAELDSGGKVPANQLPSAVTKTVQTLSDAASKSFTVTGYILSVILIDSATKEQVIGDVSFENATASANGKVTVTLAAAPSNPILVIITSIAL